ncbi:MAG: anaerobic ribonucleoside-triphosphate reductase activating protein [Oscillospiraceae bacterium]|nr:anaerobic ribonucleoside-triphosphate reductase activating protein [Oscillospiraceae bacterium]
MKIAGLQKLTLLDYPNKIACTVFISGCNMSCGYCHNWQMVAGCDPVMNNEDFFAFLDSRKGKLTGVCVTGGEPLMSDGIEGFVRTIKEKGFAVKLDTNGSYPDKLHGMLEQNLIDYVAMDVKNSPDKYNLTAGIGFRLMEVRRSIEILLSCDVDYEFRTTVVRGLHDESDFHEIGKMIQGAKKYYLQNFVQSPSVPKRLEGFSGEELQAFAEIMRGYIPNTEVR